MLTNSGLFADASNFELRYVKDYARITEIVEALRVLELKVVLTSGSFDILHEGHSMYLEAARGYGDFLIVGLDSDEKVRLRKGPGRPAVPELERLRMVTHQRGVGLVTLKTLRRAEMVADQGGPAGRAGRDGRDLHRRARSPSWRRNTAARSRSSTGWRPSAPRPGCACCSWGWPRCHSAVRTASRADPGRDRRDRRSAETGAALPAGPPRRVRSAPRPAPRRRRGAAAGVDVRGRLPGDEQGDPRACPGPRPRSYLASAGYPAYGWSSVDDLPGAVDGDLLVVPDEEIMRALVAEHDLARRRVRAHVPALGPGLERGRSTGVLRPARSRPTSWIGASPRWPTTRPRVQLGLVAAGGRGRGPRRVRAARRPQRTPTHRVRAVYRR